MRPPLTRATSAAERMAERARWTDWADLAARDLGALLAVTTEMAEPADQRLLEAYRCMVQAEALLDEVRVARKKP